MGVGEAFIDHAAGMPLSSRRPSIAPYAMTSAAYAPSSGHLADSRAPVDAQSRASVGPQFGFVDDPVELPMRSRTKSYVLMGAVIAAFLAVFLTVALSGGGATPTAAPDKATGAPTER